MVSQQVFSAARTTTAGERVPFVFGADESKENDNEQTGPIFKQPISG